VLEPRLLDWVKDGGRLVIQYQTPDADPKDRLAPIRSRSRATADRRGCADAPDHSAQYPPPMRRTRSRTTTSRAGCRSAGSFANPYDSHYETVLSSNDTNEPARDGGLLYTRWGKGVFIYTGLAWFRQLPAGVPGAYRLFANLVSAAPTATP
jgi:hypothetical protein